MSTIVIVDLGTGNLRSVSKALAHVAGDNDDGGTGNGGRVRISTEPAVIRDAGHLLLPGQGAIGAWMAQLDANPKLREAVAARLKDGPVLGICLGLEALYARSEENGGTDGLGLFPGTVRHFRHAHASNATATAVKLPHKIPHMGWNRVRQTRAHPLWHGINDAERFYFVHSYFVDSKSGDEVVGECDYGGVFTAAAARGNLFATQFHPEKSQLAGLRLLQNFVNWNGAV